jgi:uncharacterized protein (DUF2252 family)
MGETGRVPRSEPTPVGAELGRAARARRPRSSLADFPPATGRDPVAIVSAGDGLRLEWLLGERYRRMSASAFACYRGSAALMAHDLGGMPDSGIRTQLCGDAHIANFGVFAAPDRELLFDVNDFDETAVGPFEWDLQRLAASGVLAARDAGLDEAFARRVARASTEAYRRNIRRHATMGELDVWYDRIGVAQLLAMSTSKRMQRRIERSADKARTRDSASAAAKLTEEVDGRLRFRDDPPLLLRLPDLEEGRLAEGMAGYRSTLTPERRHLLDRFEVVDIAHKVVGVGSVGTRCLVVLLVGTHQGEPLVLQFKEAGASVLEAVAGPSTYRHGGERVVQGQRVMQAAGDIFLGWTTDLGRHQYYWRQLRDMKWSPELSTLRPEGLEHYAALARAHARAGNRVAIAAYLGSGPVAVEAIADFAVAYAERAEADHRALLAAIDDGRLPSGEVAVPDLPIRRVTTGEE